VGMERAAALARERRGANDWVSNSEGFVLAYSGHLEAARKKSQLAADLARKTERRDTEALYEADAAVREALFGNVPTARQRAVDALELSKSRDVVYGVGFALALSGDSSRSEALTEDLSRRFPEDTRVQFNYAPTLRALLALDHGEPSKAVELLQTTIPYESGSPTTGGSEYLLAPVISTRPMSVALPIWPLIKGRKPPGNFRKSSIAAVSWSAIRSAHWRTCNWAGLTHCRVIRPKLNLPIRISLCSGKMRTPTSLSSSRPKPSMQSCDGCVALLCELGVG